MTRLSGASAARFELLLVDKGRGGTLGDRGTWGEIVERLAAVQRSNLSRGIGPSGGGLSPRDGDFLTESRQREQGIQKMQREQR